MSTVTLDAVDQLAGVLPSTVTPSEFALILRRAHEVFGATNTEMAAPPLPLPPLPSAAALSVTAPPPAPSVDAQAARSGLDWTEAEEAELDRLHAAGLPMTQIAQQLDRPYEATRKRLDRRAKGQAPVAGRDSTAPQDFRRRKDGWTAAEVARIGAMRAAGQSFRAIGDAMGRDADAVRSAYRKATPAAGDPVKVIPPVRKDVWTDTADDELVRLFLAAKKMPEIAAALGRTVKACQVRITKLRAMGRFDIPHRSSPGGAPAAPPAPKGLTGMQRRIWAHLDLLSDDFTAADDLYLVEGLASGKSSSELADQLGCDAGTLVARFRSMRFGAIMDPRGGLSIDGQRDLLVALRVRAAAGV